MPYSNAQHSQQHAIHYNAIQYSAVQYNRSQCDPMQPNTRQQNTWLHKTTPLQYNTHTHTHTYIYIHTHTHIHTVVLMQTRTGTVQRSKGSKTLVQQSEHPASLKQGNGSDRRWTSARLRAISPKSGFLLPGHERRRLQMRVHRPKCF